MPLESDRSTLRNRLRYYLSRRRRGKLRLPSRFPETVRRLSEMSFAQIRNTAFWVKPRGSHNHTVDHRVDYFSHQVCPGRIWTRRTKSPTADLHSVGRRLSGRLMTSYGRPAWPSAPDLLEIVGMSRRGLTGPVQDKLNIRVDNPVTQRVVRDNVSVATRIVKQQIVGVRLSVVVPEKFLNYFRVYHGFLILATRRVLPIGLVRFLIGQWIKHPTSCWLVENCPYRFYLRRHCLEEFLPNGASIAGSYQLQRSRRRLGRSKRVMNAKKLRVHTALRLQNHRARYRAR